MKPPFIHYIPAKADRKPGFMNFIIRNGALSQFLQQLSQSADPRFNGFTTGIRVIQAHGIRFGSTNAMVKHHLEKMLKRPDAVKLFSYGIPEGTNRGRRLLVSKMGFHTDCDHIALAAGGQNALDAVLGTLFEKGDRIGTDPLTYPGVKTAAKLLGLHLIPIQSRDREMTEEGIRYTVQNENIRDSM